MSNWLPNNYLSIQPPRINKINRIIANISIQINPTSKANGISRDKDPVVSLCPTVQIRRKVNMFRWNVLELVTPVFLVVFAESYMPLAASDTSFRLHETVVAEQVFSAC